MAKNLQVLILEPDNELRFRGPFTDVVTANLKLINPTCRAVCFKVKTTAPKRYCVRPNSGLIKPKEQMTVAVMLQPFDYDPSEKNKHKFMVQTMFAPDGEIESQEALWKDVSPENLMDSKLKCVFEMPPVENNVEVLEEAVNQTSVKHAQQERQASPKINNVEAELQKASESNKRLIMEMNQLKDENNQLRDESKFEEGYFYLPKVDTNITELSNLKMSSQAVSPGYVIELGFWTKLDIIAGMILFFVIVITIVVCSITPICPLFRFCPFNKKFLKNADGLQTNYGTLNTKPSNKKKVLRPYIMDIQKEVESSDYSDCNFGDHMELSLSKMDENEKDPSSTTVNGSTKTTKVGRLSYKLKYEQDLKKLTIKIIKANDLMLLEPNSLPVDNYVRIRLYRSQRSIFNFNRHKQHQSFSFDKLDLEVQTRIKRKTENPVFNEKFAIFVEEKHLKNYIMRLQMCDFDHYSCHTVKGETQSKFCEMKIFNGEEKSFDCEFTEPIEMPMSVLL
ncbi:vesicle-associated membrane synaptobrevin-binding synaptotagmin-1-like [Octopus vulgaris]|uniref:Vesicle-associated membrane synaptobrevin-binding synaptotagmin-1-like n=1 Tax=Octopus vulgaris TaxID=6645 RepID=A0AA36AV09_OCTVU|nr:vesicle-associated membrane synaptobrevin-binding synaptotagmin-1-like [Octopus vulgaris]